MADNPQQSNDLQSTDAQQLASFPTLQRWYIEKQAEPRQYEPPPPYQASYSPEQGVQVTTEPTSEVIMRSTHHKEANDHLCFSIFTMLLCCLPFGIIAIIKSLDVRARNAGEDYVGAEKMSRSAKNWNIAALVVGIIMYLLVIIVMVCFVLVGPGGGKSLGAGRGGQTVDIGGGGGNDDGEYSWG